MNSNQINILKDKLHIDLNTEKQEIFEKYLNLFIEENAKVNLISKNDEKFLFEKHVFDSLAINLFLEKYNFDTDGKKLLDIGTGGGFPLIPVGILYDKIKAYGLDSTSKKLKLVNEMASELKLKNIQTICDRAENIQKSYKNKFDIVVSRALADLSSSLKYAFPLLKKDGTYIAYKSKKTSEEISAAKSMLKAHNAEVVDIIEYQLPLEEVYNRNLVVVKFK